MENNLKQIKIVPLEAAQLPRARGDVDFAVVNGNYAVSSGMKFTSAGAGKKPRLRELGGGARLTSTSLL